MRPERIFGCVGLSLSLLCSAFGQTENAVPEAIPTNIKYKLIAPLTEATNLALGPKGVLYGTTEFFSAGGGRVFSLTPPTVPTGKWSAKTLHVFRTPGPNFLAELVVSPNGRVIYGTATQGGPKYGCGALYSLTQREADPARWDAKILKWFDDGPDGCAPVAGLVSDANGVLYGMTSGDSVFNRGLIFSYTPKVAGYRVLYRFTGGLDGCAVVGRLLLRENVLFGASGACGEFNRGTIFRFALPSSPGSFAALAHLSATSGHIVEHGLVSGKNNALIGTALSGAAGGHGTVLQYKPTTKLSALYRSTKATGINPYQTPIVDRTGTIFFATKSGGRFNSGTLVRLAPSAATGTWQATVLHSFGVNEGAGPIIADAKGNLFGIAYRSGIYQITGSGFKP